MEEHNVTCFKKEQKTNFTLKHNLKNNSKIKEETNSGVKEFLHHNSVSKVNLFPNWLVHQPLRLHVDPYHVELQLLLSTCQPTPSKTLSNKSINNDETKQSDIIVSWK